MCGRYLPGQIALGCRVSGSSGYKVNLPTFDDVETAARRIERLALRTPVLTSRTVDRQTGANVFFKCENFQRAGAFKFRGAYNALSQLPSTASQRGVATFSSGNHAQAVALAANMLGIPATIVMPSDAPRSKCDATREYGGRIVFYDRHREDREKLVAHLVAEGGLTFVHPYDNPQIIAGQGTAAAELFDEVGRLDALFVSLGGGGLLSGSLLAASALAPDCQVYGVEPEAGNDGQQSLRLGSIVRIPVPNTIADGAQTTHIGLSNFEIIRRDVADILTATDAALVETLKFFATRMKLVVEPTGCLGLAAVWALGRQLVGQRVGIIVTGGNIDPGRLAEFLRE
ncbi:MAG TPA: threo-3-hydroxy-L-aspartate ammonia-lyase [Geobacterales bacterium]|nr:threo-3-hydroxy-L-aspartate ammonia-lyase [Geobacterales bacterium]